MSLSTELNYYLEVNPKAEGVSSKEVNIKTPEGVSIEDIQKVTITYEDHLIEYLMIYPNNLVLYFKIKSGIIEVKSNSPVIENQNGQLEFQNPGTE